MSQAHKVRFGLRLLGIFILMTLISLIVAVIRISSFEWIGDILESYGIFVTTTPLLVIGNLIIFALTCLIGFYIGRGQDKWDSVYLKYYSEDYNFNKKHRIYTLIPISPFREGSSGVRDLGEYLVLFPEGTERKERRQAKISLLLLILIFFIVLIKDYFMSSTIIFYIPRPIFKTCVFGFIDTLSLLLTLLMSLSLGEFSFERKFLCNWSVCQEAPTIVKEYISYRLAEGCIYVIPIHMLLECNQPLRDKVEFAKSKYRDYKKAESTI